MPATYPEQIPILSTIPQQQHYWGPYVDGADRYIFGFRSGDGFITVVKSTDAGDTWAEVDGANARDGDNGTLPSFSVCPHKDYPTTPTLYVVYLAQADSFLHVATFDTGTDLWGLVDVASTIGFPAGPPGPGTNDNSFYAVYRTDDDDIVVFGTMTMDIVGAGLRWRIGYTKFHTLLGTWDAWTQILTPAVAGMACLSNGVALGTGNRVHLFYRLQNQIVPPVDVDSFVMQCTLKTGDVLDIPQELFAYGSVANPGNLRRLSNVKTRPLVGPPAGVQMVMSLFMNYGLGVFGDSDRVYVIAGDSDDQPVWNTTLIKTLVHDPFTGEGFRLGGNQVFASSTVQDEIQISWGENTYDAFGVVTNATIMLSASLDGVTFGAEALFYTSTFPGFSMDPTFTAAGPVSASNYAFAAQFSDGVDDLLLYWEAVAPPVAIPETGIGGGGNKWFKPANLPAANIFSCCLKKFSQRVMDANLQYTMPCHMEDSHQGYMFPRQGREFWRRGAVPTPLAITGDVAVVTMEVPTGYNGLIYGVSCNYSGPAFVDGNGDLEWRLGIGPVWARDMGRVLFEFGSPEQPLQLSDHIKVRGGQRLRWIVNAPNAGGTVTPLTTLITCAIQGWVYPLDWRK